MVQRSNSRNFTTHVDALRNLYRYALVFIVWNGVILRSKLVWLLFATTMTSVLFLVILTDLRQTIVERSFSTINGNSEVINLSSVDSKIMKLGKQVSIFSKSLSEWCCLDSSFWILCEFINSGPYLPWDPTVGSDQGGNSFTLASQGYTVSILTPREYPGHMDIISFLLPCPTWQILLSVDMIDPRASAF